MMISKYVSYKEAVKSDAAIRHGIDNTPNDDQLRAMKNVATNVFDQVRAHFGIPIGVSSFFRSVKVNRAVGGSGTSQHCLGEAIDIDADIYGHVTNRQIFDFIRNNLTFDQLINEFPDSTGEPSWVHVSLKRNGTQRGQILQAIKEKNWSGKMVTKYIPWAD